MRVVVVGGGVIGLLTAMECARAGAGVDLLDADDIPSPRATSNDLHRVVRALHRGDAALTRAGARALVGWLDVQRLVKGNGEAGGEQFFHQAGVLTVMRASDRPANLGLLAGAGHGTGADGAAAQALSGSELRDRYRQIRVDDGLEAILEPAAGAVLAGQALAAMARWLGGQPGVRLHPHCRVTAVDGGAVRLADGSTAAGDSVLIAAGPWSRELLPGALADGMTLYRQTMLSYAPPEDEGWAGTPAILGLGPERDAWLMPPVAGTPARLSAASACRAVPAMAGRDTPGEWRDHLTGRFASLLAGFDPAAVTGAADGYYLSAGEDSRPLLACLRAGEAADGGGPGSVWAYAACGGMSFKFAPLIARALADRVTGRPPRPAGLDWVDRPRPPAAAAREEGRGGGRGDGEPGGGQPGSRRRMS